MVGLMPASLAKLEEFKKSSALVTSLVPVWSPFLKCHPISSFFILKGASPLS